MKEQQKNKINKEKNQRENKSLDTFQYDSVLQKKIDLRIRIDCKNVEIFDEIVTRAKQCFRFTHITV